MRLENMKNDIPETPDFIHKMIKFTFVFYHVKNPTPEVNRKQCFVFYFLLFDYKQHVLIKREEMIFERRDA